MDILLEKKGIIPNSVGGLGNQMFQMAAAKAASLYHKCPLYLLAKSNYSNEHNQKDDYTETIFSTFGTKVPFEYQLMYDHFLRSFFHYTPHANHTLYTPFKPWGPESCPPGTYMTSFYQYYPALEPYIDDIRKLFLEGLRPQLERLKQFNIDPNCTGFLHVRRGNYLKYSDTFTVLPFEYYELALEYIRIGIPGDSKLIYVLTDDIEWAKNQALFRQPFFRIFDSTDELEGMALMSLCSKFAILANSSYSWWGAMLGAASKNNVVVYPASWIKNTSSDPIQLFPSSWIPMHYEQYALTKMAVTGEKGIVITPTGGLGNTLFVYSAGYICSKHWGCPLFVTKTKEGGNPHNTKGLRYRDSILSCIAEEIPITADTPEYNLVLGKHLGYKSFHPTNGFAPWLPSQVSPNTILQGYYQFYPVLQPFESELRDIFKKGLESVLLSVKTAYPDTGTTTAFLHIRRGDYLKYPDIHCLQPLDYYMRAIKELSARNPAISKLYVLSDDVEWIEAQEFFKFDIFSIVKGLDEIETMALMTLCTGGAICANSTFSWWGAFLGAYAVRNPVVVPADWIRGQEIVALFPDEWIVI